LIVVFFHKLSVNCLFFKFSFKKYVNLSFFVINQISLYLFLFFIKFFNLTLNLVNANYRKVFINLNRKLSKWETNAWTNVSTRVIFLINKNLLLSLHSIMVGSWKTRLSFILMMNKIRKNYLKRFVNCCHYMFPDLMHQHLIGKLEKLIWNSNLRDILHYTILK